MSQPFAFNRMELAGSLGDLGTLLPIAIAMVVLNGMNPLGLFLAIGIFYLAAGIYFRTTVPVQPMKVIGAYAVAASLGPGQIQASTLLMGVLLLAVGLTGAIDAIRKFTPRSVIRGVQLSTGILLLSGGVRFIMGTSAFQTLRNLCEPHLAIQSLGPLPISLVIGGISGVLTLLLLDNRRVPAGLVVVGGGAAAGILLGARADLTAAGLFPGLPVLLPFGFPSGTDLTFAFFALVLPQLPMTLGNAALAYTDLSREYFGEDSVRVTNRKACVSMALANLLSFVLGGMPLCHGAGGLAAHFRFGARTAGSNVMIGSAFVLMALVLGDRIVEVLNLLPMSVLGVLLIFAGAQLSLTVMDLSERREYFVAVMILGITLAFNLAAGFLTGILLAHLFRWKRLSI